MKHGQCNYPNCNSKAKTRYALVPLCNYHQFLIAEETLDYYQSQQRQKKKLSYFDRKHYLEIANKIPWSRVMEDIRNGVTTCDSSE